MGKDPRIEEATTIYAIVSEVLGTPGCCKERFINFWQGRQGSLQLSPGFTFYKGTGVCVDRVTRHAHPDNEPMAEEANRGIRNFCPSCSPSLVREPNGESETAIATR